MEAVFEGKKSGAKAFKVTTAITTLKAAKNSQPASSKYHSVIDISPATAQESKPVFLAPSTMNSHTRALSGDELLFGRRVRSFLHVLLHARLVASLDLLQFGLLIRGEHLIQFVVQARSLDRHLGLNLCLLGR
jgi:hypothetical protein